MMDSFIVCYRKFNQNTWQVWLLQVRLIFLSLFFILPATTAQAGSIQIKSVNLAAVNQAYLISVDSEIILNATLEQALEKGVVLYFATKFSLVDSRWYWLNDEVARSKLRVGLRYYALTRQYHLNYPSYSQSFNTLQEALQALGQLHDFPVSIKSELRQDVEYIASLRVWLDLTRMPKPFQVEAIGSNQWNLSSEKLEWRMKLPTPEQPLFIKGH
ncbi:MAG: DUF4390 domain-containing protein [Nitrosomonas sp.]|nr:MAG: DUF4390 domain-containing protein [Nitrosomonas sp.]